MQQQYSDYQNTSTQNMNEQNRYINPVPQQQIIQATSIPQNYQGQNLYINSVPQSYPDGYLMNNTNQMASGVIQYGQVPRDPEGLKQLMLNQYKSLIQCTNVLLVLRGVKYFFFDFN